ncbi:MAG: sigma-70 family RNA polymerase sigma factor [Deltaproteobacteria bacterium]|nr:sigma-70 family RNA polymerase sigma factor [Deltaproteobacteria bacterium]
MRRKRAPVPEELEWVRRSRKGDKEAFSRLVERYRKRIYGLTYGMLGNREDALDMTQETFLKAYRSLPGFRGGSDFYTWLYRIAYNRVIDHYRKEGRKRHVEYDDTYLPSDEESIRTPPSSYFNPGRELEKKELGRVITDAVQSLPEQQRAVILLREIEGLAYEEIAASLGIRKGTVMSRLHYARQRLQEILRPYLKEGEIGEG